jgi:hypothetical protein
MKTFQSRLTTGMISASVFGLGRPLGIAISDGPQPHTKAIAENPVTRVAVSFNREGPVGRVTRRRETKGQLAIIGLAMPGSYSLRVSIRVLGSRMEREL